MDMEIVRNLIDSGVYLYVDNGVLKYRAKRGKFSEEQKKLVRENKDEIVNYIMELQQYQINQSYKLPGIKNRKEFSQIYLSYAQQRLWFLDQLGEGSAEYNMTGKFSVKGAFNVTAFKKVLCTLLDRHEVLRTHFANVDGKPKQIIATEYNLPFKQNDLSMLDKTEQTQLLKKLSKEEANTPFNLSKDLMLRMCLLKLSDSEHIILYTIHHIACDGWSMVIFDKEINELYEAYSNGEVSPLHPLKVQYADYTLWQREWLRGDFLKQQLYYWKKRLTGIPPVHSLPLDRPRPTQQTFKGKTHYQIIDKETVLEVKAACQQHSVTLFIFLQTVFAVLLSRYSNALDIVVGSPITGRVHRDVEPLIGLFVNTLVIRTDLRDDPLFSELLKANKQTILEAYNHQHIPFEMLVEEINIRRNLSYNPLVQILLNVFEPGSMSSAAKKIQSNDKLYGELELSAKTDITLYVYELDDKLHFSWSYQSDIFNDATIHQLAKSFFTIVSQVLKNSDISIKNINLADKREQEVILHQSKPVEQLCSGATIHSKVEEQSVRTPNFIAIRSGKKEITYECLNKRACILAKYLCNRQEYKAGSIVGVFVSRNIDMVVAILGVLKSGCIYLPLDTGLPEKRIEYMISACEVKTVITTFDLNQRLPNDIECVLLDRNSFKNNIDVLSHDINNPRFASHVIYTSGSTGFPKGVVGTHESVINRLEWMQKEFPYEDSEVACHITPCGFVRAVWELFLPLSSGVPIVIIDSDKVKDPTLLSTIISDEKITRLVTTPSFANEIISLPESERNNLSCLKYWFVSGEPLRSDMVKQFYCCFPHVLLCNLYGSSEVMSDVCFHTVEKNLSEKPVPIGKAVSNTSLLVLDDAKNILPIGVPGELYIGGKSVALGYVNDEKLTGEKFIPNTFSDDPKDRLYRTGDYVRRLPDGDLEYIGRIDDQVKIRGFRIELSEIEIHLAQHALVNHCRVIAREDSPGDRRLVAYIIVKSTNSAVDRNYADVLRAHLLISLPDYMVPSAYIVLDSLPLMPNGKLDKKALPVPDHEAYSREQYIAPETEMEKILVDIWARLLDIESEKISVAADFFALGGHSLLATRLINLIREQTGAKLPLRKIFEYPSIAQLSKEITQEIPDIYQSLALHSEKILKNIDIVSDLDDRELQELIK